MWTFFHVKTGELSIDYENEGIIKFKPKRSNKFILQDLNFGYLPAADSATILKQRMKKIMKNWSSFSQVTTILNFRELPVQSLVIAWWKSNDEHP